MTDVLKWLYLRLVAEMHPRRYIQLKYTDGK